MAEAPAEIDYVMPIMWPVQELHLDTGHYEVLYTSLTTK